MKVSHLLLAVVAVAGLSACCYTPCPRPCPRPCAPAAPSYCAPSCAPAPYAAHSAKRMYVEPPIRAGRVPVAPSLKLALALCVLAIVLIGLYPKPVVMAALRVAAPLF